MRRNVPPKRKRPPREKRILKRQVHILKNTLRSLQSEFDENVRKRKGLQYRLLTRTEKQEIEQAKKSLLEINQKNKELSKTITALKRQINKLFEMAFES